MLGIDFFRERYTFIVFAIKDEDISRWNFEAILICYGNKWNLLLFFAQIRLSRI